MSITRSRSSSISKSPGPSSHLRTVNTVLAALIVVLFGIHGILGALQMTGLGHMVAHALSWTLLGLVALHALIGLYLIRATLIAQRNAGASYAWLNRRYWASRISGCAILIFLVVHVLVFNTGESTPVRLAFFGTPQLFLSILLVISIAFHVLLNAAPMLISLGVGPVRDRTYDIVFVLAIILLATAVGFVIYFIRWSVF